MPIPFFVAATIVFILFLIGVTDKDGRKGNQ